MDQYLTEKNVKILFEERKYVSVTSCDNESNNPSIRSIFQVALPTIYFLYFLQFDQRLEFLKHQSEILMRLFYQIFYLPCL